MSAEALLDGRVMLHGGDCLDVLKTLPENSADACVCDPPYHLTSIVERFGGNGAAKAQHGTNGAFARASRGFMGKQWDGGDIAFRPDVWREVLRVLKPGGHLLAFAAARGYGRMQVAIEEAGFETRDCILEIIDTDPRVAAFVDSLNDAQRCAFLQIVVESSDVGGLMAWMFGTGFPKNHNIDLDYEKRFCDEGKDAAGRTVWRYSDDGEVMAREAPFRHPLAQQFAGFGTALKPAFEPIVMARKPLALGSVAANVEAYGTGAINIDAGRIAVGANDPNRRNNSSVDRLGGIGGGVVYGEGGTRASRPPTLQGDRYPSNVIIAEGAPIASAFPNDAGRIFYSAKADDHDRVGSKHPTVKPVDLMQYLVRMVTSPGDTVLDCFAGTGTTGEAAFREGRKAILIEREAEYRDDIRRRMALALAGPDERKRESLKAKAPPPAFDAGSLFAGLES